MSFQSPKRFYQFEYQEFVYREPVTGVLLAELIESKGLQDYELAGIKIERDALSHGYSMGLGQNKHTITFKKVRST